MLALIELVFLVAGLLAFLAIHVWKNWRYYYLGSKLPGHSIINYWDSPITLGSLEQNTRLVIKYHENIRLKSKHPFMKSWHGNKLIIEFLDPNLVQKICQEELVKDPFIFELLHSLTNGKGIFVENLIPKWKNHRKIIAVHSFKFSALKSFVEVFGEEATILADKMGTLASLGKPFEPVNFFNLASFSMILRTMTNLDLKIQQNYMDHHPFTTGVDKVFRLLTLRFFRPWLLINPLYNKTTYKDEESAAVKDAREFVEGVIAKVRENMVAENVKIANKTMIDIPHDSKESTRTFVEVIIRNQLDPNCPRQNVMTHDELVAEVITVLSAGFDTTKSTNSFVLNMLAIHQNIQKEVYDEIISVLGDDPSVHPTYVQLQELELLTRVIKETLRLFPPGDFLARTTPKEIEVAGFLIPAGATLSVCIYAMHRDPKYWKNPHVFDPDRFLPEEIAKRNPNCYIPFSSGPRNCLGYKYAMLQMKTTLSTIIRRFHIIPGDTCKTMADTRFEFGTTLIPLPGNDIKLVHRKPKNVVSRERF